MLKYRIPQIVTLTQYLPVICLQENKKALQIIDLQGF